MWKDCIFIVYYLFVLRDLFVCESVDLGIEQDYLEQADGPV